MAKPLRPDSVGVLHGIGYSPPGREYAPIVPQGRWKKRASRLLGAMRLNPSVARDFHPFLKDAELWLEAAMGQLAGAAGGVCGPIESQALATTAWQLAYSRYWMWKASEDPTNLKLVETASRLADAARQNALAAYDMAVKLFRVRHVAETDPLAAFEDFERRVEERMAKEKAHARDSEGDRSRHGDVCVDNTVEVKDPPEPEDLTLENEPA